MFGPGEELFIPYANENYDDNDDDDDDDDNNNNNNNNNMWLQMGCHPVAVAIMRVHKWDSVYHKTFDSGICKDNWLKALLILNTFSLFCKEKSLQRGAELLSEEISTCVCVYKNISNKNNFKTSFRF